MKKIHTIESMKAEAGEENDGCKNIFILGKWLSCQVLYPEHRDESKSDFVWRFDNTKISEDRAACLLDYLK